ncbi:MAG: Na/Pi symporter [Gammaproteobacteria bacterium]|nr:Na/Pi symporter [Gammaproteobacteria bacterium]
MILQSLGGLGLFLLGMVVMTEGLRALAGDAVRRSLIRFTRSPASGAVTGALCTAAVQSSSVTTVAAIGFVAADLMSFPSALGIVFGANIGSTVTGWMVQLIGFKLKLGELTLPLVFVGAVLRLFASGRAGGAGFTIAGFGLVFVGVTEMQEGMAALRDAISFAGLPGDTLGGRLALVGIGIGFTAVAQSSGAGVAATLTALAAGMVDFEQAAALVIGMDVGTTVTALIAGLGAGANARRTALSHVVFNLMTGVVALALIDPYILLWDTLWPGELAARRGTALVLFHTTFNVLGVVIVVPFARPFARMMESLVPGPSPAYVTWLDPSLLEDPALALNAAHGSIRLELLALLRHVNAMLGDAENGRAVNLAELQTALDETHAYVDRIHIVSAEGSDWRRLVETMHALDHLQRLHERCDEEVERAATARMSEELGEPRTLLIESNAAIMRDVDEERWLEAAARARETSTRIHERVRSFRASVMERVGAAELDVPTGTRRLESIRWLRRVSKHVQRIMQHASEAMLAAGGDRGPRGTPGGFDA